MKIDFSRGAWNTNDVTYAYTYRFPGTPEFRQLDDCVENRPDDTNRFGCDWENISILTRTAVSAPVRIETRCAFRDLGAPLITVAKCMHDESGVQKYGDYYEREYYCAFDLTEFLTEGKNVIEVKSEDFKTIWNVHYLWK